MTLQRFVERLIWLCMLPPAGFAVALVVSHLVLLEQRWGALAQAMAAAAARSVTQLLEVRLSSLQLLARALEAQAVRPDGSLDLDRVRRLAQNHVDVHGAHLVVGDRQGRMLFNTQLRPGAALPPMPRPEGRSAVEVVLRDGVAAVGDPVMGPIVDRWIIPLAIPIRFGEETRWALVSVIEVPEIEARLNEFSLPPRWTLQVRDSLGQTIIRVGDGRRIVAPRQALPQGLQDQERDDHIVRLGLAPWSVDLHAPPSGLLQDPRHLAMMLIVSLLAAAGAAYWGGLIVSRRLIRSMASLVESVEDPPAGQDIEEVAQVRRRLLDLQRQRESATQVERRRIGLELHDDLQQKLALLHLDLATLQRSPPQSSTDLARKTDRALRLVDQSIESTRRMVRNLRPPTLEQMGIGTALNDLARLTQSARRPDHPHPLEIDVQVLGAEDGLDEAPEVVFTLYRVAQEALNNVVKHSDAHRVDVQLDLSDPHWAILEVVDDGKGFDLLGVQPIQAAGRGDAADPGPVLSGNGLCGMTERVEALGGSLEICTQPGDGTVLTARLPLPPRAAPDPQALG